MSFCCNIPFVKITVFLLCCQVFYDMSMNFCCHASCWPFTPWCKIQHWQLSRIPTNYQNYWVHLWNGRECPLHKEEAFYCHILSMPNNSIQIEKEIFSLMNLQKVGWRSCQHLDQGAIWPMKGQIISLILYWREVDLG